MQISFTINLGGYESMKVSSSELPSIEDCLVEVYDALEQVEHSKIQGFRQYSIFNIVRRSARDMLFLQETAEVLALIPPEKRVVVEEKMLEKIKNIADGSNKKNGENGKAEEEKGVKE